MWLRRPYFQVLLLGPSHFFEMGVDLPHRRDVFDTDAEVEQVDFMLAVCDGVDGDVVAVGSIGLRCSNFVLRRCCRRHCCRVLRSGTGGSLLLRRHVVWCIELTGGRQTVGGKCLQEGRIVQQKDKVHGVKQSFREWMRGLRTIVQCSLSLYSMSSINAHYMGIYRRRLVRRLP